MTTGISSTQSTYTSATSYVSSISTEEESSQAVASSTTTASYDTYTPSEEGLAAVAAAASETAAEEVTEESADDTAVGDVATEDTTVEDDIIEDVEAEDVGDVDAEEEVEEEAEVEEEVEEEVDDWQSKVDAYAESFNISFNDVKMFALSSQQNTLSTMLNAISSEPDSIWEQSWFADSQTANYAGKYLAMSAAGTHGVQATDDEETSSTTSVEYNNYALDLFQDPEETE